MKYMIQRPIVNALLRAIALKQPDFRAGLMAAYDFDVADGRPSYVPVGRVGLAVYAAALAVVFKTWAFGRVDGYGCIIKIPSVLR